MSRVEVAVAEPAILGESPVWDPEAQVLWWIDIDGNLVHRFDPSSGVDEAKPVPARPGSLARTEVPGVLLVAMEHELVWFDWATGAVTPWLALEEPGVGIRLNDGKTDPAGRFVVGSMFADTSVGKTVGSLHQIDADGTARVLRTEVGTANGLGFDAARGRMYFADTPTLSVIQWDYDPATGGHTNERQFFDYEAVDGKPDGACIDDDGCYWSASVYGWAVTRITPDGVVDRRIELPVAKPSMPAFGGPNRDTLFVTTIGAGGTFPSEPGRDGVEPGALLAIDLSAQGITGSADVPFAGRPA